jgi:Lon protease-like protein
MADTDFDLSSMKDALKKCDENIKVFEQAILKEMNTKMEYQRIIRVLTEKEVQKQDMMKNVKLEIVRGDPADAGADIDGD